MSDKRNEPALSCPFCGPMDGNTPGVIKRRAPKLGSDRYHYWVKHPMCGAEGGHGLTEEQAIENWNHRPAPAAHAEPVAYRYAPPAGNRQLPRFTHQPKPVLVKAGWTETVLYSHPDSQAVALVEKVDSLRHELRANACGIQYPRTDCGWTKLAEKVEHLGTDIRKWLMERGKP
jgi:hypothetical protein